VTPEERQQMQERLKQYETAERRLNRLQEAEGVFNSGTVARIAILVNPNASSQTPLVAWQGNLAGDRWDSVCWARDEPGLVEEIVSAVTNILDRRIQDAQKQVADA